MATSDAQRNAARLAGRLAARTGKPLTACPYDVRRQPVLARWFVRGYRSVAGPGGVSFDD